MAILGYAESPRNILDRFCSADNKASTYGVWQAFQTICTATQHRDPVGCCNYVNQVARERPNMFLCPSDNGYFFSPNDCGETIAISSRFGPDAIMFPTEDSEQQVRSTQRQVAQQLSQVTSRPVVQKPLQMQGPVRRPQPLEDNDYEDVPPAVLVDTVGYQAMEFALNLFKSLNVQGDSVISPLQPQQLLSNLIEVASPTARAELFRAIRLYPEQLARLIKSLDRISKSTVNTIETAAANFFARDSKVNQTYHQALKLRDVDVIPVDFSHPAQAARQANNWVSEKTHRLINEILNPGSVNAYTRMVLANSIFFKGKWKYTFIKTEPSTFQATPNRKISINSMFQLNKLRYGEKQFADGNGLRWVELPYEGDNLAMLVFLPLQPHRLQEALRQLQPYDLASIMAELHVPYINTKVNLRLPRFTLTDSVSLIPALQSLGVNAIFNDKDALPYLNREATLVSDVTQRSYLSVDEFGTKATSVASLSIVTLSITPQFRDVKFDVDQPFALMIVDKQERYPIFIGQVYEPQE
ncbi:hypothetical protein pipiens_019922 [Culex pipiens pipiens]|uniref:Serpin domain-containing protein n=1 Tax=Culex pipiens pipiens TaxID=38569 RepID=A0ABD1DQ92_CULPP